MLTIKWLLFCFHASKAPLLAGWEVCHHLGFQASAVHGELDGIFNVLWGALEDCRRQEIKFIPLAVESLVGWHELAVAEIRKLAVALARQTGQEDKECQSHLYQRLSVLLVRGNCALLVNRIPENNTADIDGQE